MIFSNNVQYKNLVVWTCALLVSTYVVCERLSVMHKQVCVQLTSNSKILSKFSRKGLSGISDQKAAPPIKNFRFEMTKVYSEISPPPPKIEIQPFLGTLSIFSFDSRVAH